MNGRINLAEGKVKYQCCVLYRVLFMILQFTNEIYLTWLCLPVLHWLQWGVLEQTPVPPVELHSGRQIRLVYLVASRGEHVTEERRKLIFKQSISVSLDWYGQNKFYNNVIFNIYIYLYIFHEMPRLNTPASIQ